MLSEVIEDLEGDATVPAPASEPSKDPEPSKDQELKISELIGKNLKDVESNLQLKSPEQKETKKIGTGSKALSSSNCLLSIHSPLPTRSQSAMSSRSKFVKKSLNTVG